MYTIDYCTGVKDQVNGSLEDAKQAAQDGMEYTQENVRILDENGQEVAVSRWYGVSPSEEDPVLVPFGNFGFYAEWQEGN